MTIDITKVSSNENAIKWFFSLNASPKVSQIVALEVLQGARNKVDMALIKRFLSDFERIYPSKEDQIKAQELLEVYKLSHGIGFGDCLVAASAIRLNETLYTLNRKHFEPIEGLKIEIPY